MRKLVLAGVCVLALSGRAYAEQPVIDIQSIFRMVQQIAILKQQLTQTMSIFQSLAHGGNMGSIVPGLGQMQNLFPTDPNSVQNLMMGRGGAAGMPGGINGFYNNNLSANRIYTPNVPGTRGEMYQRNAQRLAGIQAMSQQMYQGMAQRLPLLNQLQQRINTTKDAKEVADLQARIAVEQSYIQAQQAQAISLQSMARASEESQRQQDWEWEQKQLDESIRNHGGGSGLGGFAGLGVPRS